MVFVSILNGSDESTQRMRNPRPAALATGLPNCPKGKAMKTLSFMCLLVALAVVALAQGPSDADIQAAMERGKTTPAKKLWEEIKKKQQYRINRAGFGDPIEKKVLILSDLDRIALEAAEAKRQ